MKISIFIWNSITWWRSRRRIPSTSLQKCRNKWNYCENEMVRYMQVLSSTKMLTLFCMQPLYWSKWNYQLIDLILFDKINKLTTFGILFFRLSIIIVHGLIIALDAEITGFFSFSWFHFRCICWAYFHCACFMF